MDPDEIIERVLAGEKNEFRRITTLCNQSLYRVAIAFLKNQSDAEDVIQSTYLKAYVHLHTFKKQSSLLTWMTRILINECKMMLRRRRPVDGLDGDHLNEVLKKTTNPENVMDSMDKKIIGELIEQSVQSLPEKYRLVYVLREVNEVSTEETATTLGLTHENVKVRLHRAKSIMRDTILRRIPARELFPFGNQRCSNLTEKVMNAIDALPIVEWS